MGLFMSQSVDEKKNIVSQVDPQASSEDFKITEHKKEQHEVVPLGTQSSKKEPRSTDAAEQDRQLQIERRKKRREKILQTRKERGGKRKTETEAKSKAEGDAVQQEIKKGIATNDTKSRALPMTLDCKLIAPGQSHSSDATLAQTIPAFILPATEKAASVYEHFFEPEGRIGRLLFWFVLVPTILVFLYLSIFASDIYISRTKFAIRGPSVSTGSDALSSVLKTTSSIISDAYVVYNYIHSLDMLEKLDAKLHIREHYSDRSHDIWYRLQRPVTQDALLKYWKWAAIVSADQESGILTVEVKAFSAKMAHDICQGVLDNSEALVNLMNERAREDAISRASKEVQRAEERIRAAQTAMKKYRESTVILDPQAVATGLYGLVNRLEGDITKTTAELAEARTFMKGNSPRVVTLQNRLKVLERQLMAEKKRLAGELEKDAPLSSLLSEFQSLTLEEEFARSSLTSAMTALESAKIQAGAKTLYLESFENPILPDESLYPRPVYFSFIFMICDMLLLGLTSLIIAAVREHAGF